jgi:hypothetical protein
MASGVGRQREMVHADVDVAPRPERRDRAPEPSMSILLDGVGQLGRQDAALGLETLGQVRIGIECDALRAAARRSVPACARRRPRSAWAGRRSGPRSSTQSRCCARHRPPARTPARRAGCGAPPSAPAASKSCTPKLSRLKPRPRCRCSRASSMVRGSISIACSPPGASVNPRAQDRHQPRQRRIVEEGRACRRPGAAGSPAAPRPSCATCRATSRSR